MKKSEKIGLVLFWLLTAMITSFPYIIGWYNSSCDTVYTGLLIGVEDGNSYLAKMLAGAKGEWLFKTPYTAFPQKGFLAFFPYIILGKLTGSDGDYQTRIIIFHLFRIIGVGFCVYSIYSFIAIYIQEINLRFSSLLLSTFGGGLGFLYLFGLQNLWSYLPLEFYSPETFGFLSFLSIPHLVWARAFLFLGLARYLEKKSNYIREGLIIGVLWNFMAFMQPLSVPIGWLVLLAYNLFQIILVKWNKCYGIQKYSLDDLLRLLLIVLVSSPLVIYTFFAFQIDPFLKNWQSQNIILSPPITEYLLAYGWIVPFALIGMVKNLNRLPQGLLISWACLLPLLIYMPYPLQRRLAEGGFVILSVLAIDGLSRVRNKMGKTEIFWFLVNFVTTAIIFSGALRAVSSKAFPLYISEEENQLFQKVNKLIPNQSVVLADWEISTLLPAHAPVRVIIGHGPESIRANQIRERMEFLYSQDNSSEFLNFLIDESVDYWIMNKTTPPKFMVMNSELNFLNEISESNKYVIFKVNIEY